ncbi:MAG: Uncharacterised protein [Chloroflexota bacterium]|jgi:Trk K+ transport system NAD-binding subunit|nr:hypothetical protein [Dehalococcoidia bacterium]CAI8362165.1 MAG: Uncharacterised protein [Chloroflexota bacterium]
MNIYLYGNDQIVESTLRSMLNKQNNIVLVTEDQSILDFLGHFPNVTGVHNLSLAAQDIYNIRGFDHFDVCVAVSNNYLHNLIVCKNLQLVHNVPKAICLSDNNMVFELYNSSTFNVINVENLLSETLTAMFPVPVDTNQTRMF